MAVLELSRFVPDEWRGRLPLGSRQKDEQIVSMCAWRGMGWSYSEIGRAHGVSKNAAISAVRKVIAADLAESGEPQGRVMASYENTGEE